MKEAVCGAGGVGGGEGAGGREKFPCVFTGSASKTQNSFAFSRFILKIQPAAGKRHKV